MLVISSSRFAVDGTIRHLLRCECIVTLNARSRRTQLRRLSLMPDHKLPHYLRSHRMRLGLSQAELAFLLGCRSGAKVSRYERFVRRPNVEAMFACAVVFGKCAREIFPGMFEIVRQRTFRRARVLIGRLASKQSDPTVMAKVTALRMITSKKVVPRKSLVNA